MHIIPFLILLAILCCAVFPSVESTIGAIIIIIGAIPILGTIYCIVTDLLDGDDVFDNLFMELFASAIGVGFIIFGLKWIH